MAIRRKSCDKTSNGKQFGKRLDAKPVKTRQIKDTLAEKENEIKILWESPEIRSKWQSNHPMITRGKLRTGLSQDCKPLQSQPTRRTRTRTSTKKRNFVSKLDLCSKKFQSEKHEMKDLYEHNDSISTPLDLLESEIKTSEDMTLGFDSTFSSLRQKSSLETRDEMKSSGGCGLCLSVKRGLKYGFVLASGLVICYYAYEYRDLGFEILEKYFYA